jgi:multicomponent Na+:H+ antiporter subunit G
MSNVIGIILVAVGALFNVFGCIGLIRLPDVYNRLQAATKCVTLGTCLVVIGCMLIAGTGAVIAKSLLCLAFILITSPTAAHALALGAHTSGVELWEQSVVDRFKEDKEPGV